MRSFLIATVAVCAASAAQAGGYGHGHGHYGAGGSHAFSQSSANAAAFSRSSSNAQAFGGNAQAFGGNASAAGFGGTGYGGNAYGGNQSVNFRNRVGAPPSFVSGPVYGGGNVCGSSVGLSAGAPMFSFGFSIPVEQTQCTYRENAYAVTRVTGNRTAGMLVLAQEPGMRAALAGAGLILEPVYDQQSGSWTYPQRSGVRRVRYPR